MRKDLESVKAEKEKLIVDLATLKEEHKPDTRFESEKDESSLGKGGSFALFSVFFFLEVGIHPSSPQLGVIRRLKRDP